MKNYASKNNEYFTRHEALEQIKEGIENGGRGYNGCYCDLHNEVFNVDYYIIGTAEAKKALNEYGVFEAIEVVRDYEKFNFGELLTDITNPEKLANMLWYIIGEEVISEIDSITGDYWNEWADKESNERVLTEINKMMEE